MECGTPLRACESSPMDLVGVEPTPLGLESPLGAYPARSPGSVETYLVQVYLMGLAAPGLR